MTRGLLVFKFFGNIFERIKILQSDEQYEPAACPGSDWPDTQLAQLLLHRGGTPGKTGLGTDAILFSQTKVVGYPIYMHFFFFLRIFISFAS